MINFYAIPAAFFVPIIHEWVKALCSARQGDPTPKSKGFLRGNPLKYFEPVGFFLMLMFGYGWGQPVPTSPLYYKDRRRGVILTYTIPSVVNLLLGIAVIALYTILSRVVPGSAGTGYTVFYHAMQVLSAFGVLNIGMAFFNLIPVYPLDGARVLQLFLPSQYVISMNRYEKIFQVVLLITLFFGWLQSYFLGPLTGVVVNLITSLG
jgi:Zn-dependent protease